MASWTLTVEEDQATGDAIIQFPPDLLAEAGWKEGDTLIWKITDNDGKGMWSATLTKKIDEEVKDDF